MRPLVGGVVALLVLTGCASAGGPGTSDEQAEPVPVVASDVATGPGATAPEDGPAAPSTAAGSRAGSAEVPVRSAAGVPEARTQSPPVRVVVPALDADLPVDPVGVADDGQMEVPPDAARAGWYRHGPTVGAEEGTAVLAAHSGSHITALGPLRDLVDLEPGDLVEVTREDGTTVRYAVESARLVPKATIDLADHFRRDGEHRLVLITCDGVWQEDVQSYTDNTVVTATLVP